MIVAFIYVAIGLILNLAPLGQESFCEKEGFHTFFFRNYWIPIPKSGPISRTLLGRGIDWKKGLKTSYSAQQFAFWSASQIDLYFLESDR